MSKEYEFAKRFAKMMYEGQNYGNSNLPYDYHLDRVEKVLARFGFRGKKYRVCAWLHDVIEDVRGIEYVHIRAGFGRDIADVIFSLTNQMGRNRREKFKYTYPKIRENPDALIVKLADRIANIENGLENMTSYFKMYKKEWPEFKEALFSNDDTDPRVVKMWKHLELLFDEGLWNSK